MDGRRASGDEQLYRRPARALQEMGFAALAAGLSFHANLLRICADVVLKVRILAGELEERASSFSLSSLPSRRRRPALADGAAAAKDQLFANPRNLDE